MIFTSKIENILLKRLIHSFFLNWYKTLRKSHVYPMYMYNENYMTYNTILLHNYIDWLNLIYL